MLDYNDYMLSQYQEQMAKYDRISIAMEKLGLDPDNEDDYEKYINELADDEPNF